jgi:hypothetical protein
MVCSFGCTPFFRMCRGWDGNALGYEGNGLA